VCEAGLGQAGWLGGWVTGAPGDKGEMGWLGDESFLQTAPRSLSIEGISPRWEPHARLRPSMSACDPWLNTSAGAGIGRYGWSLSSDAAGAFGTCAGAKAPGKFGPGWSVASGAAGAFWPCAGARAEAPSLFRATVATLAGAHGGSFKRQSSQRPTTGTASLLAIPPVVRVQTDVAAVSEAHEEFATVVAPVGVPSADPHECELRHMRAREERLGARAVGQVARPIEQPAVRQVVEVLLATRGLAKHVNLALPLFRTVPAWASVSRSVGRAPDRTGGRFGRWVGR